jgi:hypothetical protein
LLSSNGALLFIVNLEWHLAIGLHLFCRDFAFLVSAETCITSLSRSHRHISTGLPCSVHIALFLPRLPLGRFSLLLLGLGSRFRLSLSFPLLEPSHSASIVFILVRPA